MQYRYVILVARLVTRSKLLNTLASYYRKLFDNLNPPRFSIDGNYPGTNRNLKFPIDCIILSARLGNTLFFETVLN